MMPRCPPSPCITVIVSMKTLSAREPDHSASTKPSEITSNRPPSSTSSSVGSMILSTALSVSRRLEKSSTDARMSSIWPGVELVGDVADRPGQREDQRRHGQHGEERRLGGQPGDPVAQAAARGRDDEPPDEVPGLGRRPGSTASSSAITSYGNPHGATEPGDIRSAANQVPPLAGHNVVTADAALSEAVTRHAGPEVLESLVAIGAEAGTEEAREHGRLANEHHPVLRQYDRYGTASTRSTSTRPGTG